MVFCPLVAHFHGCSRLPVGLGRKTTRAPSLATPSGVSISESLMAPSTRELRSGCRVGTPVPGMRLLFQLWTDTLYKRSCFPELAPRPDVWSVDYRTVLSDVLSDGMVLC